MEQMRKPLQGVLNIVRFNWHFYLLSFAALLTIVLLSLFLNETLRFYSIIFCAAIISSTLISLIVSFYVYDLSGLYNFSWLDDLKISPHSKIVNINAGFDETSVLLERKFKDCELLVFDFYDPLKHTEISIKRARKAYPPFPNTKQITTENLPLPDNSADKIFAILSAHEIRNEAERKTFFKELYRVLKPSGQIIVTEHLRDAPNFLAYNIGFFHFHSKAAWLETFRCAGFETEKIISITPFIKTFVLKKYGVSS